ncbi:MAG: ferrous iron transport protein B [Fimbriimonas ginsengisoli]|uniref:Ferrous iron transport protein B n=1 Tax=Fimbriimonas ginsengisoli TaxID=1005039 RepID=A0A931LVR4_FIMGI|nr:ferrous iron transport protein B [Fimbriimonas ginsengisoli]
MAVVGNPNAGKTTLFNALTGSRQRVGNYPGVTVERISGVLKFPSGDVECLDVPGLYSLAPLSEDERVAVSAIKGDEAVSRRPDLLVCVVDASNLERNLFFYHQLCEAGLPVVVALTMVDRVASRKWKLDLARLTELLGADVVPVVGHKGKGIAELREAIARNLESPRVPRFEAELPDAVEEKVGKLRERLARSGIDYSRADVRRALLEPDEQFQSYLRDAPEMREAFDEVRPELRSPGEKGPVAGVSSRYEWAGIVERLVLSKPESGPRRSRTDHIDRLLTHRVFGLAAFGLIMLLVFESIYSFARPAMDGIQWLINGLGDLVRPMLAFSPVAQSMIVDGLINGVGAMLVFLPQILILFFFIGMLEGTGYLARAAFLMDRLLGWCGLNGRAFIPLLSSFACAIPGIMSARVMPDPKSRLATILVAPLMSCSARLPVYLLMIGAFVEPKFGAFWAGVCLFGMHLLGLVVAIPIVWFINRRMLRGRRLPFVLELPPYQMPKWRDVWLTMYFRGKVFVTTAGTVIVAMSFLIWGLSYFPRPSDAEVRYRTEYAARTQQAPDSQGADRYSTQQQLANSFLGRFGQSLEPAFAPAGFDWRITTAILSAFPARETVVPSLGIIFSLGSDAKSHRQDLQKALNDATWPDGRKLITPWSSVGLMVFFALCCQCMSTLATIKRETNSVKWPVFVFTYMTVLAYIAAVAIQQVGRLFGG